jgi:DNA polymerase-4
MPLVRALKLCPQGIYLRGNMARYREVSGRIMALFAAFSPRVQQLSIDEAFLDITGTGGIFGPPEALAKKLKAAVREGTGLTVSVGIGGNKYIAKIASGLSKPDGLCRVPPGGEEAFMRPLPVEKIWGAGEKTREIFRKHRFETCGDICRLSREALVPLFGEALGLFLYRAVRGEAAAAFDEERGSHSISAERTFAYDISDPFALESVLMDICEGLMWRMLEGSWQSRTVSLKVRYGDFSTGTARETAESPVATLDSLYGRVRALFRRKYQAGRGVRLIGAGLMNLERADLPRQKDLFDNGNEKERALEKTILEINKRFPSAALRRSRSRLGEE